MKTLHQYGMIPTLEMRCSWLGFGYAFLLHFGTTLC